jgi:RNA polymerase sigma factor (sigma-70 family)
MGGEFVCVKVTRMPGAQLDKMLHQIRDAVARERAGGQTDGELLRAFLDAKDQAAFSALVKRHGPLVLAACRRVWYQPQDAEDAFQATFLVLAQKAASLRSKESLAGWLYKVARHMAMNARRAAARRRKHEEQARAAPTTTPAWNAAWREVQGILDDEIARLPDKYREAFLLCCVEGRSRSEAARQLGLKEGTVWSRVAEARKRLQTRLARRGVALGAVLAAAGLGEGLRASVPVSLAASTATAVERVVSGKALGDVVAAQVAGLVQGVNKAVLVKKGVGAAILLLTLGVGLGVARREQVSDGQELPAPQASVVSPERADIPPAGFPKEERSVIVRGRVVGPDGTPARGADLYLQGVGSRRSGELVVRATTGADGKFGISVPRADLERGATLLATAEGCGPGWAGLDDTAEKTPLTLRLARDDVPVSGRIRDQEGRAVQGASVRIRTIKAAAGNDLTPFLEAARARGAGGDDLEWKFLGPGLECAGVPRFAEAVTTDDDGRFRLRGVGRGRLAVARVEGPAIAACDVYVVTCEAVPGVLPRSLNSSMGGSAAGSADTYYGAAFTHTATPVRELSGIVRDKDAGKPLSGVRVRSLSDPLLEARTDGGGRYRLSRVPKGGHLVALPPEDEPYLFCVKEAGGGPAGPDFELKRGVWVRGRVIDQATGKAVRARLEYFALLDGNPQARDGLGVQCSFYSHPAPCHSGEDGSFRIAVLPGPGVLAAEAEGYYLRTHEFDEAEPLFGFPPTAPCGVWASKYHALCRINPGQERQGPQCNIFVDPGVMVTGTVVGPDGRPLSGWQAYNLGRLPDSWDVRPRETATFVVHAFNPRRPRPVLFVHEGKWLAGRLPVTGTRSEALTVRLEPAASVIGRLIDGDGQARKGAVISVGWYDRDASVAFPHIAPEITTDARGRFRLEGLIPGLCYGFGDERTQCTAGPGESKDLGDIGPAR